MRHPVFIPFIALAAALGATAVACGDSEEPPAAPSLAEPLAAAVDEVIVPDFVAFADAAKGMETAVGGLCSGPTRAGLDTAQSQWRALSSAWNRVALYNLGPLDNDPIFKPIYFIESMRQRGIDYTETVRGEIRMALANPSTINTGYFEALNFNRGGLLSLEVLLFETTDEPPSQDVEAVTMDFAQSADKCTYLEGMAGLLRARAEAVRDGWTVAFDGGAPFGERLQGGSLDDGSDPVVALLVVIIEHLDYVKTRKVEAILDARLADHFYENVLATLDAVEAFLNGGSDRNVSFLDRVSEQDLQDRVDAIEAALAATRTAAAARDRTALGEAIGPLENVLRGDLADALRIRLGLNFTDGD